MEILEFIKHYGLPTFIIASCIIAIIGILKLCKVFSKIESADVRKFVYTIPNIILSFGGAAIYYAIFKLDWSTYALFAGTLVFAVVGLYWIYEQYGVRKIVRKLIAWVATWFKANIKKTLKKLGLSDDVIANIETTVNAELEKKKAQEAAAAATAEAVKQ